MVQFLVTLSPEEANSITTTSYMDFPWEEAWKVWSEMESWRESCGHVFISSAQGTVETFWLYTLRSLWMLWELSPEDHWH